MNDTDVFPVFDSTNAATRSVSFKILRDAVPNMVTVVYESPNLILTQSDGNVFTVNISDILELISDDVSDNDLVIWDANTNMFIPAGANKDPDTGEITFDNSINVPSGSINIGEALQISEGIADLVVVDLLKDKMAFSVNSDFSEDTGSSVPSYVDFGAPFILNINTDDSETLTDNPLTFSLTGTVVAPDKRLVDTITFRGGAAMTNFRASVLDSTTGIALRYIPSKAAFEGSEDGLTTIAGDNTLFFASNDEDTAGNFHLGFTPFIIEENQVIDFTIIADSVNMLGNISGVPYLVSDAHDGPDVDLLTTTASLSEGSVLFADASGVISQDNDNLFWDDTTKSFRTENIDVSGLIDFSDSSTQGHGATKSATDWHVDASVFKQDFTISSQDALPEAIFFRTDGIKMYMVGDENNLVYEYDLSTSWDTSTSVFLQSFDPSISNIGGVFFRPNGLQMFLLDFSGDDVQEFALTTAWDITTASFVQSISLVSLGGGALARDVTFKNDGLAFYISQVSDEDVEQYNLTVPWDISTATLTTTFDTGAADFAVSFKLDGTVMFVINRSAILLEFNLTTPWLISSAELTHTINLNVSDARGIFFKNDGSKFYIAEQVNETIREYNVGIDVSAPLNIRVPIDGAAASIHFVDESSFTRAQIEYQDSSQRLLIESDESNIIFDSGIFINSQGDLNLNTDVSIDSTGQTLTMTSENATGTPTIQFNDSNDADAASIEFEESSDDLVITANLGDLRLLSTSSDIEIVAGTELVGINTGSPVSRLHVYQDNAQGGASSGITVENDGTGDAVMHFVLTGDQTWTIGTDNSLDNQFSIDVGNSLSTQSPLQILTTGEIGINKTPRANHCLDIDTVTNTVVALYDTKDVTIEQGNHGQNSSTDFYFNRNDAGFNQSEFAIYNDNNNVEARRNFHMNYTDAGTVGGLSIRHSGFVAVGIGTGEEADTLLHLRSEGADTEAIVTTESTGTNAGITQKFVGDQDPDGIVTGTGGDEYYRSSADTSGTYESIEATSGTNWFKRSVLPSEMVQINSSAQFEALATAGTITVTGNLTLILNIDIVTSTVFDIVAPGDLKIISLNDKNFIYVGTGTVFTVSGAAGAQLAIQSVDMVAASTGTWFDVTGGISATLQVTRVDLINITIIGGNLGSFKRGTGIPRGPAFLVNDSQIVNRLSGFSLSDSFVTMGNVGVTQLSGGTSSAPFAELFTTTLTDISSGSFSFRSSLSNLAEDETFIRVDPGYSDAAAVLIEGLQIDLLTDTGELFDTSGVTGTFTVVADASESATAVTSVTDSSGAARFNFTVGPTLFVNQEIVISGFTTNTIYNQSALITTVGVGFFEVDYIPFGSDETGSFLSNSVTMTDTGTSLVDGDTIKIDTDSSTDYDTGAIVYNQLTNTFQINRDFTSTATGTWSQKGLDQKDSLVLTSLNPQFVSSKYIATSFVNDNSTANGSISNNTFTDMVFGTGGSALVAGSTIERWKLIDELNGTFEYTGREPFDGYITFDFTVLSSGGSVDFRFKWERSSNAEVSNQFIDFVNSNPDEIFNQRNNFLKAGFKPDDEIVISGSASNDGNYTIAEVTKGKITLVGSDTLVNESNGPTVTITALFGDLDDNVEALVNVGSDAQSITKTFPLAVATGDHIKPQITRSSGSSDITTTYATIYATQ